MKIIPLSEGSFTVAKDKKFLPFDTEKDNLKDRPEGSVLVEIQPFCVVTRRDIILLDTGLGYGEAGHAEIVKNLEANGIAATEVTKVLMSHLHKDHAGGIGHHEEDGSYTLNFPNATYFVQRREFDFAYEKSASYMTEDFDILDNSNKVFWLLDDVGTIDGYIDYELTGGHCKYHQAFWIKEDGETVFFGGDEAPQYNQMLSKYVARYDYNGKHARDLRHAWFQKGHLENWTFLFYHDVKKAVVKV